MTEPDTDYGDRLRRALQAAVDGVAPSGDGLQKIRHKIAQERNRSAWALVLGWLRAALEDFRYLIGALRAATPPVLLTLRQRAVPVLATAAATAVSALSVGAAKTLAAAKTAGAGLRHNVFPAVKSGALAVTSKVPERLRKSDSGWLRPLLAVAGAVLVAVVALFTVPKVYSVFTPASNNKNSPAPPQQSQTGGVAGTGSPSQSTGGIGVVPGASTSVSSPRSHQLTRSPSASRKCPAGSKPQGPGCVRVSPTPTSKPTGTTTPTPIASPTQSATPTPTSTTPSPSDTPTSNAPNTQSSGTGTSSPDVQPASSGAGR